MGLELYKMPLGLTEGVDIPLPQTKIKFRVMLPGNSNEEFSSQVMAEMNAQNPIPVDISDDEIQTIKVDPAVFVKVRKQIFFKTCIISAEGLPKGMNIEEFFDEYELAKKFVFDKAVELATEADLQVNNAMEKLSPTPNGKFSGQVGKNSTKRSNAMASQ